MKRRTISRFLGRGWARLSYGRFVEPFWLETNQLELSLPGLDSRLDGLSILQLSDFHLCRGVPTSHIRQAIERGRKAKCDIVALTGDFVHSGSKYVEAIAALVSSLEAPLGVYAVLGNHDHAIRMQHGIRQHKGLPEAITDALGRRGIPVLTNEYRVVEKSGAPLAVVGVEDLWSRAADLRVAVRGLADDVPRVVLAHNPATIVQAEGIRVDLMLSGHTHGGQIRIPTVADASRAPQAARFAAGLYYHDTGYLYVNKGIGYSFRFRYKVRPEIAVFRLRRPTTADSTMLGRE